jgi:multisubunit Na+/H+ antiporter MnhB subunit
MVSRLAAAVSAVLALLGGAIVWRLAVSPDSDWTVGLVVAGPVLAIGTGFGLVAVWTRQPSGSSDELSRRR